MHTPLFEDILSKGHDLRLKVTGLSMGPLIKSGEAVTLRMVEPDALRCGDIIYFIDATGSPVLHRIIKKDSNPDDSVTFITRGDALYQSDAPISERQIIGKAVCVEKSLPVLGPVVLNFDSALLTWFAPVNGFYRTLRYKFLNRTFLRRVFPVIE